VFYMTNDVPRGGPWAAVLRGTEEDDRLLAGLGGKDEIYCGKGKEVAYAGSSADKIDYVDDSCEKEERTVPAVP